MKIVQAVSTDEYFYIEPWPRLPRKTKKLLNRDNPRNKKDRLEK